MDTHAIAQNAYQAYGQVTEFKNFQSNPMPPWDELPATIQQAWAAAVEAALKATVPPVEPGAAGELQVLLGDVGLAPHQAVRAEVARQMQAHTGVDERFKAFVSGFEDAARQAGREG